MPLIARQRSRLAVLAVLALVGSLLAVSAVPVAAKDGKADNEATYSACVGAAAEDAEFTDMDGSFAEDAANCLAHYRITKGTSEGVFSPNASVTRLQMALFLSRAAGPAGIVLPAASDQGFGDIGGMSDEIQDAINQIAELDIMAGRSDNEFDPVGMVTRVDMAVHLAAFLSEAVVGPGGEDIDHKDFDSDDTGFEDLGSVTFAAYGAISDLFELGVTTGTSETMYSPAALVSRGQMAAFITRALAHTNARPAGLSVQTSDTDVFIGDEVIFTASVRDRNHQPMADVSVDFFYLEGDDDEPFDDDGACTSTSGVIHVLEGNNACETDASDFTTGSDGNLDDELTLAVDDDTTVWVWMGDLGDDFDEDDTDSVTVDISAAEAAMNVRVSDDRAENSSAVKFGEEVTFTFQVVDSDRNPVAKEGVEVTVKSTLKSGKTTSSQTRTHETDASGRVELSYSQDDPDDDSNDDASLTLTISEAGVGKDYVNDDGDPVGDLDGDEKLTLNNFVVTWDDDDAKADHLALTATRKYHEASDKGKGVGNTVRATLTDQYGDPISGASIRFESIDDPKSMDTEGETVNVGAPDVIRRTNPRGVASLKYTRDSTKTGTETFDACYTIEVKVVDDKNCDGTIQPGEFDHDGDGDGEDATKKIKDDPDVLISAEVLTHYWAEEAEDDKQNQIILVVDTANNTIVVGEVKEPLIVTYDSDDHFTVDKVAKVLADFEDALSEGDKLSWILAADENVVSTFTLSTN